MTQETAKERIYREKLELISDKSMWHMNFKSSTIKMMMKNAKQALELAENLPVSTDKISVEKLQEIRVEELKDFNSKILQAELKNQKLQEQLNTLKKALTNIKLRTERDELETYYVERNHDIRKDAIDALAAIGGDDEQSN